VFSPYYAWRRRGGGGDPGDHCAVNLVLYRPRAKRWAMTERGRGALERDAARLRIGPSALHWRGQTLEIDVDELTVPWPTRLRGRLRVHMPQVLRTSYALDAAGRHRWRPLAPCARIDVELTRPQLRWHGAAYVDSNFGDVPLERDFVRWDWSRGSLPDGRTAVLYDVERGDGTPLSLALAFDAAGRAQTLQPPPAVTLPTTGWRIGRGTRSDPGSQARVLRTFEDTPFYARSLVRTQLHGTALTAVHESLSLTRFASPVVQAMLPFRMPRRSR
jgi:carotenoid 1,2-hydratase